MAHTPEQRDRHELCGAKRKSGGTCRKFAGEGTEHRGSGRCRLHGGATPSHKKRAVVLEARKRMALFGEPVEMPSKAALRWLLHITAGTVNQLQDQVRGLTPESMDRFENQVILETFNRERDRLHQIAKTCSEAGVDEFEDPRIARLAGQMGAVIRAFADRVGLTDEQIQVAPAALRAAMLEVGPPLDEHDPVEAEWEEQERRHEQAQALGLWNEDSSEARTARLRAVGFWDADPRTWDAYVATEEAAREARRREYERAEGIEG